jgi:hypothetical protein
MKNYKIYLYPCNIQYAMFRESILVSKNGNLVSKLVHQQTKNAEKGGKPHVEDLTEVDIQDPVLSTWIILKIQYNHTARSSTFD